MRSGKHQALVGLPTGADISGSARNSAVAVTGATRREPVIHSHLASFHTGTMPVTHFTEGFK